MVDGLGGKILLYFWAKKKEKQIEAFNEKKAIIFPSQLFVFPPCWQ
jgi:hypothetical protein